jgi:inositol-phosphate transport system substrate-binding protein
MSKKAYGILALLTILATNVAACGTPEPAGTPAAQATTAPGAATNTPDLTPPTPLPVGAGETLIRVWAQANDVEHWRADNPVDAAKMVTDYKIVVQGVNDSAGWADYKKKFTLAADAGEGPEIVLSGHEDVPVWANAGYIVDFEKCKAKYPEFADVIDSLWKSGTWNGKVWAVPQDTEARPMFYSKTKLKALGWSDADIEALPDKIKSGEFTLDDLIATAKEAVDKGIVPKGYGYWHRPSKGGDFLQYYAAYGGRIYDEASDKLVISKGALLNFYKFQRRVVEEGITPENYIGTESNIWHDTVSHDKVVFWNGGVWNWSNWAKNFVKDQGGNDYLFSFIGYALQPSGIKGKPGVTLSHPLVYMITSPKAAGDKEDLYDQACAVLAKTTTTALNTRHAIDSTHLGILKSQASDPAYTKDKLLSETLYMLDYNFYQPNHTMYTPWFDIVYDGMLKAENGEVTPEQAAEDVVKLLQSEVGDYLIVEE